MNSVTIILKVFKSMPQSWSFEDLTKRNAAVRIFIYGFTDDSRIDLIESLNKHLAVM